MNNSEHYNIVTDYWKYLMGENFHWGYFMDDTISIEEATWNLTNKLLSSKHINEKTKVLDVGCGIGTTSIYLYKKYGCIVYGISNSIKGIETAKLKISKIENNKIKILLRDATDNKLKNNYFDIVLLLEMAHLIEDKYTLFKESKRVLKSDGYLLFCDLMFYRPLKPKEILKDREKLTLLDQTFGKAQIPTFNYYYDIINQLGFKEIQMEDVSKKVKPTLSFWKHNAEKIRNSNIVPFSYLDIFYKSCLILEEYFEENILGYGIIIAKK